MTCKDCFHYDVCEHDNECKMIFLCKIDNHKACQFFKDKSKIIELQEQGCYFCNNFNFELASINYTYGVGIQLAQCNTKFKKEHQFKYCPECGRKLGGADNG